MKLFFKNFDPMEISIDDNKTGDLYLEIVKRHYEEQKPFFVDNLAWTSERLHYLARIAKKELNWNWLKNDYTIDITAQLHKDLEYSVGVHGYESIPPEHHWLIYELHHCLHGIQHGKEEGRPDNLQVEWLTDDHHILPDDFVFSPEIVNGDIILINPHVGHNPWQIYLEKDYEDLNSTVKFHDRIKPAVVISSCDFQIDKQKILNTFIENDPEFVEKHTAEKILYYTGAAKIGKVTNIDQYLSIVNSPQILEFDRIEFD
jgi:hypothetical protein